MTPDLTTLAPDLTFEAAYLELVSIVEKLEAGKLPLEESLAWYERGQLLTRWCNAQLDSAELRVTQLNSDPGDTDTD